MSTLAWTCRKPRSTCPRKRGHGTRSFRFDKALGNLRELSSAFRIQMCQQARTRTASEQREKNPVRYQPRSAAAMRSSPTDRADERAAPQSGGRYRAPRGYSAPLGNLSQTFLLCEQVTVKATSSPPNNAAVSAGRSPIHRVRTATAAPRLLVFSGAVPGECWSDSGRIEATGVQP